ncbi:NTP transferase domain-containing protein, partial [Candidatus Sumerlaeota bacterium]|nr:NTP transferase domain-containing protein [Candidatus Sumerlaeota bacterium]
MKAVIVAGGEGRRIRSVARTTPKPLLEIGGCSLVEHHVNLLRRYGIREAHLTVRQRDLTAFRSKLGAKLGGATLRYHPEGDALGTAGGIAPFVGLLGGNFLVLYGDVMIAMDLGALVQ